MPAAHHILQHGHVVEQLQVLEGPPDAQTRHVARQECLDFPIFEAHHTFVQRQITADQIEHRGFAGTVWADQRGDGTWLNREAHVADSKQAAERARDAHYFQERTIRCRWFGKRWQRRRPRFCHHDLALVAVTEGTIVYATDE